MLTELQSVADSTDPIKRSRGRRGFDVVSELQKLKEIQVEVLEVTLKDLGLEAVDEALLSLAKQLGGKVLTTDYNLNMRAQVEKVLILNVNDLSNSLKPVFFQGKPHGGYPPGGEGNPTRESATLEDGTMIVVEDGQRYIGRRVEVFVTSLLQTSAGRMIFGRYVREVRVEGGASFILVAAGKGKRFGGVVPKQYSEAAGHPLWEWSARLAESLSLQSNVDELVFVVSPEDIDGLSGDIPSFRIPLTLAAGGEERSISVMNGLMAAKGDVVLVHDAARPLASEPLCRELLRKVHLTGGAIPVLPVTDALKRVTSKGLETVNREDLFRAQTPQAFAREDLIDALKRFGRGARD